jgi:hypothetical protein
VIIPGLDFVLTLRGVMVSIAADVEGRDRPKRARRKN